MVTNQRRCSAAERAVVWHGQSEPEQADDGADQAFGLAQGQAEHGPERQRAQDRQEANTRHCVAAAITGK